MVHTEKAYAKLNLSLDILGKRSDGFHDMRMVMQSIDLADTITISVQQEPGLCLTADLPFLPKGSGNIAAKAAARFFEQTRLPVPGLAIDIQKRIPVCAGMAGGSSDGAAVLRLLRRICSPELSRERLEESCEITEIGLRNGTLEDCAGCPYTACLHFVERGDCFYGGVMVREVYPAIRAADGVILLCPNYNDALSANLTAAINRLTALYRAAPFENTAVFAIVVSGYSGGDIVASQVVSAMNMNKGFWLPPGFCLLETANDAGTAVRLPGIDERLERFAENIRMQLCTDV